MGRLFRILATISACVVAGLALLWASMPHPGASIRDFFRHLAEHAGAALFVAAVVIVLVELVLDAVRRDEWRELFGRFRPESNARHESTRQLLARLDSFRTLIHRLDERDRESFVAFLRGYFQRIFEIGRALAESVEDDNRATPIAIPLRKTLVDEAFSTAMDSVGRGDKYVTVTCPKFWSAWNLGTRDASTGQFLRKCRDFGHDAAVDIQRVFIVFGVRRDGRWQINEHTVAILRQHSQPGKVEVRVWPTANRTEAETTIRSDHMGAWHLSRGHDELQFVFKPRYFDRDPFILENIDVVVNADEITRLLNRFTELWDGGIPIKDFLSDHLSDTALPRRQCAEDPTRPYPTKAEWTKYYDTLYNYR